MKKILIVESNKIVITLLTNKINEYMDHQVEVLSVATFNDMKRTIDTYQKDIYITVVDSTIEKTSEDSVISLSKSYEIPIVIFSDDEQHKPTSEFMKLNNVLDFILKNTINSIEYTAGFIKRILNNSAYTALVVDDSRFYREKFKKDLQKLNLKVLTAKDGEEAYNLLTSNKEKITLMLTDYNMPKVDGIELVSKVRKIHKKDSLTILAISSNDDMQTLTHFIRVGADDYIHKPYSFDELSVRVSSNLNTIELFKKTKDLANRDFLTGAYNRRYFFETSAAIISKNYRKKQNIAIATIDIDNFKNINDTHGHDVGDIAIIEVVKTIHKCMRSSDLFARFGGEEFCVLLEDIKMENLEKLFEKIRVMFEKNHLLISDELSINYTVSIGVAFKVSDDINEMLKISDNALYDAKNSGRNRVVIY